ncbi:membrane protein [Pseudaeromonas paramecii]|uniref:Membrane protein n=2 Tax=Pseudaeromonas paramecii TaxID=2138166 RepID=A0ABP8QG50_9GAMM
MTRSDTVSIRHMPLHIGRRDWLLMLLAFVLSRVLFYAIGYFGAMHYNVETDLVDPIQQGLLDSVEVEIPQIFCQFDCSWFLGIGDVGYDPYPFGMTTGHGSNWAFFPLFPMLGHALGALLGIGTLKAFYLIANLSFMTALPLFFLCLRQLGLSLELSRFGVLLLAFSPYSVYFIAPYTEAPFLAMMLALFLFGYRHQWLGVAIAGILMAATRNLGVMVVFPVLVLAVQEYGWRELLRFGDRGLRVLLTLWCIPLALFSFMLYMHFHVGDAFAFKHIQLAWGRILDNPFEYWWDGFETGGRKYYLSVVILLGWLLNGYLFWQKRYGEALFMLICIFVPLMTSTNAIPRYLFALYPTMLALVLLVRNKPLLRPLMLACSAMLAGYFVVAWVNAKFFVT